MRRLPWWDLAAALLLAWAGLMAWRGAQAGAQARWVLFMDEQISYDAVRALLRPDSPKAWLRAAVDGGDQRYGRLFYNLQAAAALLPERLLGPRGQVLASRALQIACVLACAAWLGWILLPQGPWRLLGAASLVAVAPAEYFLGMPKPEPEQTLCLLIFTGLAMQRGWRFGGHWLWLGLAFGLKISALPALAVFGAAAFHSARFEGALKAAGSFLLGWILAVPVLLAGPKGWKSWAAWTLHNTGHGRDDARVGWRDWLAWASESGAWHPATGLLALALAALLWLAWLRRREGAALDARPKAAFWLGAAGLLWAGMIILKVKRVWGFYLWTPLLLLHASALAAAAWGWSKGGRPRALAAGLGLMLALNASAALPRLARGLEALAGRERDPEHLAKLADREALLKAVAGREPRSLSLDPHAYDPELPGAALTPIWGYFNAWAAGPELVVLGPLHEASERAAPSNAEYAAIQAGMKERARHVAGAKGRCAAAPCYKAERAGRLVLLWRMGETGGRTR